MTTQPASKTPTRTQLKLYGSSTVYDESLKRIRYLFDEFEQVIVAFSGGKDSTVIFNLALMVAKEKGRLPLPVMFLDQESELDSTIAMVRSVMNHAEVKPQWYQIPFRLFNATSTVDHWLHCWNPLSEDQWMRTKETCAITDNVYGTDRFADLFEATLAVDYAGVKACRIGGIRCEESPRRALGMTSQLTYKHITWGKKYRNPQHFTFYPIYDWTLTDVWKAIHDHGWAYSRHYDEMYRYGIAPRDMRVSSLMHETAVKNLFSLQEIEPETYQKMTARLGGIDMAAKMGSAYFPKKLPPMFMSWVEYRDHLLKKLIDNPSWTQRFSARFAKQDRIYLPVFGDQVTKSQIASILTNDWEGVLAQNFIASSKKQRARHAYRDAVQS